MRTEIKAEINQWCIGSAAWAPAVPKAMSVEQKRRLQTCIADVLPYFI